MTAPKKNSEKEATKVQSVVEGVKPGTTVKFEGENFRIADEIGHMALMKFAHYAEAGVDVEDLGGLSSFYEVLQDCIHEDDWGRFERLAMKSKAKVEDLLPVMERAMEMITARPTE